MTEIEKKAEEFLIKEYHLIRPKRLSDNEWENYVKSYSIEFKAYKDGYEQGQKDFDTDVTKLLNSYGVTFIDTNSIGGLIGLHQIMLDLEKENEELKAIISKLKCCGNCKHWRYSCLNEDYICKRTEEIIKSLECYTEKMDKCDKWELAE